MYMYIYIYIYIYIYRTSENSSVHYTLSRTSFLIFFTLPPGSENFREC